MFFLLPDFGSPVYTICFSFSQMLALLFIPFGFLAPKDLPIVWFSNVLTMSKNLGARKTNGINRKAKIWEQEKQMV
jgi:hypothetical protein